ncbi:MAG TPA: maleylpyruvate isomerase family mycothiol-dependent enzyme [Chloroflexia bacterium]|nr:maleylpyruvate isomerase family mycothiol-dependent enzyme [Chloroflexia bacterium]
MTTAEKSARPDRKTLLKHKAAERGELLALCRSLSPEEWERPSLCEGWRVRDIIAHLAGSQSDWPTYLKGNPNKASQTIVDRRRTLPTSQLTDEFAGQIRPNFIAKLLPQAFLWEDWVHHQDILWVLGPERQRKQDPERLHLVLNFITPRYIKRHSGVRLVATDLDWQAGEGQEVKGSAEALIMAMSRRPIALERLEGPGLSLLKR